MSALQVIHPIGDFNPALLWQDENSIYVSKNGDDANSGLTKYDPKLTIQAGIDALVSSTAPTFHAVRIGSGSYVENVVLKTSAGPPSFGINLLGNGVNITPTAGVALSIDPAAAAGAFWVVRNINMFPGGAGPHQAAVLDGSTVPGNGWSVDFTNCAFISFIGAAAGPLLNVDDITGAVNIHDCRFQTFISGQKAISMTGSSAIRVQASQIRSTDARAVEVLTEECRFDAGDSFIETTDPGTTEYAIHVISGSVFLMDTGVRASTGRCIAARTEKAGDFADVVTINTEFTASISHGAGVAMIFADAALGDPDSGVDVQIIDSELQGLESGDGGAGWAIEATNGSFVGVSGGIMFAARECIMASAPARSGTFLNIFQVFIESEGDGGRNVVDQSDDSFTFFDGNCRLDMGDLGALGATILSLSDTATSFLRNTRFSDNSAGGLTNELIASGTNTILLADGVTFLTASLAAAVTVLQADSPDSAGLTFAFLTAPPAGVETFVLGNGPGGAGPGLAFGSPRAINAVTLMLDAVCVVAGAPGTTFVTLYSSNPGQPPALFNIVGGAGSNFQGNIAFAPATINAAFLLRPGDVLQASITVAGGDVVPVGNLFIQ